MKRLRFGELEDWERWDANGNPIPNGERVEMRDSEAVHKRRFAEEPEYHAWCVKKGMFSA